MVLARSFTV